MMYTVVDTETGMVLGVYLKEEDVVYPEPDPND